jgi:hypothetical protein
VVFLEVEGIVSAMTRLYKSYRKPFEFALSPDDMITSCFVE